MKLELSDGNEAPKKTGNSTDIISNIERALENPQVRGMLQAVLENQGIDTQQLGITDGGQNMSQQSEPTEMPTETVENQVESSEAALITINSADDIIEFINQVSQMSPMGDKTNLGTIRSHIQSNKDEIEAQLENQ